jgi:hypothetical protein
MRKTKMEEEKMVIDIHADKGRANDNYEGFSESIRNRFDTSVKAAKGILFKTDAVGLFDTFLENLPDYARQHYTCNACKHFVDSYGNIVVISGDGEKFSALWDETNTPELFLPSVKAMNNLIRKSSVVSLFITEYKVLGTPVTGEWEHMSVEMPIGIYVSKVPANAERIMAEKTEEFKMLKTALATYSLDNVTLIETLLKTDTLVRSEKFIGIVEWFKTLYSTIGSVKNEKVKDNYIWLAAVTAPTGFCHIKSSVVGTLLDDLTMGLPFDTIS